MNDQIYYGSGFKHPMPTPGTNLAIADRLNEIGFPKESKDMIAYACLKAFMQRGWVLLLDKRKTPPLYAAFPPDMSASVLKL